MYLVHDVFGFNSTMAFNYFGLSVSEEFLHRKEVRTHAIDKLLSSLLVRGQYRYGRVLTLWVLLFDFDTGMIYNKLNISLKH